MSEDAANILTRDVRLCTLSTNWKDLGMMKLDAEFVENVGTEIAKALNSGDDDLAVKIIIRVVTDMARDAQERTGDIDEPVYALELVTRQMVTLLKRGLVSESHIVH